MNSNCILCHSDLSGLTLELGKLPPCNRFTPQPEFSSPTYPLTLTECPNCTLIQLLSAPPIEALTPIVPWIRYNEPDAHLDALSSQLLPQLKSETPIYGVGPFDQPLLNKLTSQGYSCETLDLLASDPKNRPDFYPYLETLQAHLQPQGMQTLAKTKPRSQLILCRYLLEHCRDPLAALASFRPLLAENGAVLIEVPDSSKFLAHKDYSFIWEEHVSYFTEATLTRLILQAGYDLLSLIRIEGQLEDALIALIQPLPQAVSSLTSPLKPQPVASLAAILTNKPLPLKKGGWEGLCPIPLFQGGRSSLAGAEASLGSQPPSLFAAYATGFANLRLAYQAALATLCEQGRQVAVFGAGHQAIMFINAFGLQNFISYLVDDDVNKQAYFSPGAHLPIVSSAKMLADDKIDLCLLAVSPRIESKIQEKCAAFLQRGGKMYSIFPGSHLYQAPRWEKESASCIL